MRQQHITEFLESYWWYEGDRKNILNKQKIKFPLARLNKDILSVIFSFLPFNSFLDVRRVCKRFYVTSQVTWSQWKNYLIRNGKRKITLESKHVSKRTPWCKMNNTTRMCCIVGHYQRESMVSKFDGVEQLDFYKESLKLGGQKYLKKMEATDRAINKTAQSLCFDLPKGHFVSPRTQRILDYQKCKNAKRRRELNHKLETGRTAYQEFLKRNDFIPKTKKIKQ